MASAWKSSKRDSGAMPSKGVAGSVESNGQSSRARKKRKLNLVEKVNFNFAMLENIMPRMKQRTHLLYDHWSGTDNYNSQSFEDDFSNYLSSDINNLAWPLYNNDWIASAQQNRISSGHSLTMRNGLDNKEVIANSIFPMCHGALITKGDDINQRMGDSVNIAGVHITGRIESFITFPSFTDVGVQKLYSQRTYNRPTGLLLDQSRKVRLMVVETIDLKEYTSQTNNQNVYVTSEWPTTLRGTQKMVVTGAPRLPNLLEVAETETAVNLTDPEVMMDGRWLGIDRHYRSNKDDRNVWKNPANGRRLAFRVLHDATFNLGPPPNHDYTGDYVSNVRFGKGHYVNVDFFLKFRDLRMDYDIDNDGVAGVTNGSRQIQFYLFDDSIDGTDAISDAIQGLNNLSNTDRGANMSDEVLRRGYARTRARLKGDFFFTDAL